MAALLRAIKQGNVRSIKLIIESKRYGDDMLQTEAGTTALIEACKFGDKKTGVKMAKILLRNNAKVESRDYTGRNALHWACSKANKEIIELFIKSNETLDLHAKDFNGNSVMYHTVSSGDCDFVHYVCRLYAENGGGVETKNNQGISAVDLALKLGHKSCAVVVNRVTGRSRTLNSTGFKDDNCRVLKNNSPPDDDDALKLIQNTGLVDKAKGRSPHILIRSNEKAITFNTGRLHKTKFISLSSDDLTLKERVKLPALSVGEFPLLDMYGRQRSITDPAQNQERNADIAPRKHGFFNGELLPNMGESRLPNTYKDLLVDFNSIYSAENTASYRKGVSKPKEKTKIVTFSESVESGQNKEDDAKAEDKAAKNKLTRKMSKMSDAKFNSTFISKGKERRKSRKSRDDDG